MTKDQLISLIKKILGAGLKKWLTLFFHLILYHLVGKVILEGEERMSPRTNSKEVMLDAAEAIVLEKGARHMTLDAVAARATVSKGGLLYHFPSKEALMKAMLDRLVKRHEQAWEKRRKGSREGSRPGIKAYIQAITGRDQKMDQIGSAILAAAAHDPKLLAPLREVFRERWSVFAESEVKFRRAAVIFLAVNGLVLLELLSLSPLSIKERNELSEELLRLADE